MLAPEMSFTELKVPRRPEWDATTTAAELNRREKESFMEWRRDIAMYVVLYRSWFHFQQLLFTNVLCFLQA